MPEDAFPQQKYRANERCSDAHTNAHLEGEVEFSIVPWPGVSHPKDVDRE